MARWSYSTRTACPISTRYPRVGTTSGHKLYAFDMLAGDGEDLRPWPLALRKGALAELLSDPVDGIFIAEYEQGEIGDVLFHVAWSRSASIMVIAPAGANIG